MDDIHHRIWSARFVHGVCVVVPVENVTGMLLSVCHGMVIAPYPSGYPCTKSRRWTLSLVKVFTPWPCFWPWTVSPSKEVPSGQRKYTCPSKSGHPLTCHSYFRLARYVFQVHCDDTPSMHSYTLDHSWTARQRNKGMSCFWLPPATVTCRAMVKGAVGRQYNNETTLELVHQRLLAEFDHLQTSGHESIAGIFEKCAATSLKFYQEMEEDDVDDANDDEGNSNDDEATDGWWWSGGTSTWRCGRVTDSNGRSLTCIVLELLLVKHDFYDESGVMFTLFECISINSITESVRGFFVGSSATRFHYPYFCLGIGLLRFCIRCNTSSLPGTTRGYYFIVIDNG